MTDNKIDIPQFNYKIDLLELSKTEEYKNYAVLERVFEGDTVTIKHSKLNINLKAKVIKITKNILTKRIEKIELGSFKDNIATSINNSIQEIKKEIVVVKSEYQKAIENATDLITGSSGGNLVIQRDANGKPYELDIMDTDDIMTAMEIWRFNEGGLAHSSNGFNGPFTVGLTKDGHIVGDLITGLKIVGEQIVGGLIKGVQIQQVDGEIVLADLFKNIYGGALKINDIGGNPNVYLGSETETTIYTGGTLKLYNDSLTKQRVGLGTDKDFDSGILWLEDTSNKNRIMLAADILGPSLVIFDSVGEVATTVGETHITMKGDITAGNGFNNIGRKTSADWSGTISPGATVNITHNLGYNPIVQYDGTLGNCVLTTNHTDINTLQIHCEGAIWGGAVRLY